MQSVLVRSISLLRQAMSVACVISIRNYRYACYSSSAVKDVCLNKLI